MNRTLKAMAAIMLMMVFAVGCNKPDEPNNSGNSNDDGNGTITVPNGAINGKFTINENRSVVYFSKGNLQYQASTRIWRFADNQYDYLGGNNQNISETNSGWIDLFGWGTGDNPTNASTENNDYSNYTEWGSNVISNGGIVGNFWRTLTLDEWNYVFRIRNTSSGIHFALAEVAGVIGVILLPDNWNRATYTLFKTDQGGAGFSENKIDATDWVNIFEANGAVFLPASGYRYGISLFVAGSQGWYWSAPSSGGECSELTFGKSFNGSSFLHLDNYEVHDWTQGNSVRLVCLAE